MPNSRQCLRVRDSLFIYRYDRSRRVGDFGFGKSVSPAVCVRTVVYWSTTAENIYAGIRGKKQIRCRFADTGRGSCNETKRLAGGEGEKMRPQNSTHCQVVLILKGLDEGALVVPAGFRKHGGWEPEKAVEMPRSAST